MATTRAVAGSSRRLAPSGRSVSPAVRGARGRNGASGGGDTTTKTSYGNVPPVLDDRPAEPYFPTHVEGMATAGTQTDGDYACALTYTYPHRFWLVTDTRTRKVVITRGDSVHLMPMVWNERHGVVPPDVSPQVTIGRDGDTVADVTPWPMLSQPMGIHFGDNVALDGDGTYTVRVEVDAPSGHRTGDLMPNDPLTFEFEWDYRAIEVEAIEVEAIEYRDIGRQREGMPGAVPSMDMPAVGMSQAPSPDALPGTRADLGTTAGARFHAAVVDDATAYGGSADESYLAVSPRTKYNRYALPMLSLSATLTHDGDTVHDGPLSTALDPDLGYHYGAIVPHAGSGATIDLRVDAPPQVARHEGYETAFLEMDDRSGQF